MLIVLDLGMLRSLILVLLTHNPNQFKTYLPCSSNRKIVIADGTTTAVAGIGGVQVTSNMVLKNVFHVPQLSTNLVSIQILT